MIGAEGGTCKDERREDGIAKRHQFGLSRILGKEGTSRRSKKIRGGGTPRIFSSKGELPENGAEGGTCRTASEESERAAHVTNERREVVVRVKNKTDRYDPSVL